MSDKTLGNQSKNRIHRWSEAMAKINPGKTHFPAQKKIDSNDFFLGRLDDGMKQFWIYREQLREAAEEIISKLADVQTVYKCDQDIYGADMPPERIVKYTKDVQSLEKEFHEPAFAFTVNQVVFQEMLKERYPLPEGKSVHGIRDDFQVVCRANNDRNDDFNIRQKWHDLTCDCRSGSHFGPSLLGILLDVLHPEKSSEETSEKTPDKKEPVPASTKS